MEILLILLIPLGILAFIALIVALNKWVSNRDKLEVDTYVEKLRQAGYSEKEIIILAEEKSDKIKQRHASAYGGYRGTT